MSYSENPSKVLGPLGVHIAYGEISPNVFVIVGSRVDDLRARVEKLNRRAQKIGGRITVEISTYACKIFEQTAWRPEAGGLVRSQLEYTDTGRVLTVGVARLGGTVPKVAGWTLVAKVEHHGEIGNVISRAPGYEEFPLPVELRTAASTCDHCRVNRMRNDTFVLVSDAGEQKRIGRNCLADFIRTEDVAGALAMWQFFYLLRASLSEYGSDDDEGGGGSGRIVIGTRHFIGCTIAAIRQNGWVSSKEANEHSKTATKTIASLLAYPCRSNLSRDRQEWLDGQPKESDSAEADSIIEWAGTLGERPLLTDYLSNLRVSIALGYVDNRAEGLVASSVIAYRRELEKEVERQKREKAPPSSHFGEVGKRYPFEGLEIIAVRHIDGNYGVTTLLVLVDGEGRRFKWFASGEKNFARGNIVSGKGTVKKHEEWQGSAETLLSRCAFEKQEKPAVAANG